MRARALLLFVLSAVVAPSACSTPVETPSDAGIVDEPAPQAKFAIATGPEAFDGARWFDHPWPSDFRRDASGTIRLDGWPNPRNAKLLSTYLNALRGKIDGFSTAAAGYLTFTAAIDEATLPQDAKASLDPGSALQLVNLQEGTPDFGKRVPVIWKFRDRVGDYYFSSNTLSWAPALGHPMRSNARYAIVATRAITGRSGRAAEPNDELKQLLEGKGPLAGKWGPALDALAKAGIPREKIAHLSVFTTNDPTRETLAVAEHARTLPPPKLKTIEVETEAHEWFDRYTGVYEGSPDYQQGEPPFLNDGGGFVFEGGKPVKQRDFELRFKLVVPNADKCKPPASGYPIVMYAHGTTGDWESFLKDGTALALAGKCIASMGVDQIFHGTRPGAPPLEDPNRDSKISLAFFNLSNAIAARTNTRQSAIDEVARARLITSGGLVVPADVSKTKAAITFDPKRVGFFGHSQGGLNGALLLAIDDQTRGGVLSGAGAAISYSLLLKTKPDPSVAGLVRAFLDVAPENDDELTPLHPAMSLVQTLVDPADPLHYYAGIAKEPFAGRVPKSVLMTEGVHPDGSGDNFSPPRTIEAGAIAGGFPLLEPVVFDVPEITQLDGLPPVAPPVKGNAASGKATVALAQYSPPPGRDGHFVVFNVPKARTQTTAFCASLLAEPVPVISK